MDRWSQLSMSEKSDLMSLYIRNGISSLEEIKKHYNSFADGGHLYQDGGPDDDKTFVSSQTSEIGWMPEVQITADRPEWQKGLTDYDWARAKQYYSDENGYITPEGFTFLKNVASKNRTGTSNFIRDVNKLSYIPNAAVGAIGAIPAAAGLIAATTNPAVDALLTAQAIATAPKNIKEGIQNIQEGNTWQGIGDLGLTALDFLGAGQLVGRISRMLNKGYRAKHAYNTIVPISYENATKRGKEWLHNMWYNTEIDSKKLRDTYEEEVYKALRKNHALSNEDVKKLTPRIADNREDAFRLYLKMPQKHDTYTRLNNGNYRMNEASIPDLLLPYIHSKNDPGFTHGGLWSADFYLEPETNLGLWHYTDRWDLNPFQRHNLSPIKRAVNKLNSFETRLQDIAQNYRRKKYESGQWGNGNYSWLNSTLNKFRTDGRMPWQTREELSYIKQLSNKIENSQILKNLEDRIKNIEVGNLLGGKPFMMETIIPYKVTEDNIERLKGFTNDELDGLYTIINDKNKVNIKHE